MKSITLLFVFTIVLKGFSQNSVFMLFDHTNAPFVNDSVTWVKTDTSDVKWVGTRNGLYRFYNNAWAVYTTSNSTLPDNRIDKFEIAYDNTIWFLNHNKGFIKFDGTNFIVYNKTNLPSLPTDSIAGIAIDSNDVFMWTNYHGIIKFNSVTNSIYHIDTINSCLQNIKSLVFHSNHTFYGMCLTSGVNPSAINPQDRSDSINYANDFIISNTNTISINYHFNYFFQTIQIMSILSDKYYNRFEIYTNSYGPGPYDWDQRLRKYDANNTLIGDEIQNRSPDKQRVRTGYGEYFIYNPGGPDKFEVNIYSPFFTGGFGIWNSIIPDPEIINFDTDKHNNVWLSTPKGLVAYNDQGVILNFKEIGLQNYKLFPNPNNGNFRVEFSNKNTANYQLVILDVFGKEVYTSSVTSNNHDLNLDLHSGVYLLKVLDLQSMESFSRKIIIQN